LTRENRTDEHTATDCNRSYDQSIPHFRGFHLLLHLLTADAEIKRRPEEGGSSIVAMREAAKNNSRERATQLKQSIRTVTVQIPTFLWVLLKLSRE